MRSPGRRLLRLRLKPHPPLVFALLATIVCIVFVTSAPSAEAREQAQSSYVYNSARDLNQVVASIALYPDPLLSQVLAASTFPDEIPAAAEWADRHHCLTGQDLAAAIAEDHLPWDGSVQALLPFPSVLARMARDMDWTTNLGGAFLSQRADLMDALQEMRKRARKYCYLRSNPQQTVMPGPYLAILPVNPALIAVPHYDSAAVFTAPKPGATTAGAVTFGCAVKLGPAFRPWGWGISQFHWADHDVFTHRQASRYEAQDRVEKHELQPRTQIELDQQDRCAVCGD
jgi:hypothetical protein